MFSKMHAVMMCASVSYDVCIRELLCVLQWIILCDALLMWLLRLKQLSSDMSAQPVHAGLRGTSTHVLPAHFGVSSHAIRVVVADTLRYVLKFTALVIQRYT